MPGLEDALLAAAGPAEPMSGEEELPAGDGDIGLEVAAEEMMSALEAKDAKSLVRALRSAFEILESQPHAEYGEE
jgi:hypothetical protein